MNARNSFVRMLCASALLVLVATRLAFAAPGAHGPDGEHLDGPASAGSATATPRMEAKSEAFELVARLSAGELSILIDRYATNEPVLGMQVEVEFSGRKARAAFHADHGDYSVDDATFLKALQVPGKHALVVTIVGTTESDILEGVLTVTPGAQPHGHRPWWHYAAVLGAALFAIAAGALLLRRRQRRHHAALALLASLFLLAPPVPAAPGAHGPDGEHLEQGAGASTGDTLRRLPDGSVNVPKPAQRRLEIRTVMAPFTEAAATVELPGRVAMDPNSSGRIQAARGGRVQPGPRGLPVPGQAVRKGDVLAYLQHQPDPLALGSQRAQLSELRASREIAEKRVKRLESLEGTVARKDMEAARIEASSLAQRERGVAASIETPEALVAPVSGVVARADAVLGQVVEPKDILFEIVDPRHALVEATTADATLTARIAQASLREAPQATLAFVGAARSLRDGALPLSFRLRMEAGSAPLAIGQPVTVVAQLAERIRGIVLPAGAVTRNAANEAVVWIKAGAERFLPQPVQIRPLDATTVLVTSGLGADNRVVVHGASLLAQVR